MTSVTICPCRPSTPGPRSSGASCSPAFREGAEVLAPRRIDDRYLDGTRVRLRRMAHVGGATQLELTQKVPSAGRSAPRRERSTTLYLSEAEHAVFARLPAAELRKSRLSIGPYGVDVFHGDLDGLYLAEAEFGAAQDAAAFSCRPRFCRAEVTTDRRFTGGELVRASAAQVRAWAREYGLELRYEVSTARGHRRHHEHRADGHHAARAALAAGELRAAQADEAEDHGPDGEHAAEHVEGGLGGLGLLGGQDEQRVDHGPRAYRTWPCRTALVAALGRLDLALVVPAQIRVPVRPLGGTVEGHERQLGDRLARPQDDRDPRQVGDLERQRPGEPGVHEPGGGVDDQAEPAQRAVVGGDVPRARRGRSLALEPTSIHRTGTLLVGRTSTIARPLLKNCVGRSPAACACAGDGRRSSAV